MLFWFTGNCKSADESAKYAVNSQWQTALYVAVKHGSCKVISILINNKLMVIAEEVVKAAAGNWDSGEEVMTLLLEQRGGDMVITEEIVMTIASRFGEEAMTLLLEQHGGDIVITEEVSKWERDDDNLAWAAWDRHSGYKRGGKSSRNMRPGKGLENYWGTF
jgi:hypothetical protein